MPTKKPTGKRAPFKPQPSIEYLSDCFDYDPGTGVITWKRRPREHFPTNKAWAVWNGKYAGMEAGCVRPDGYRQVIFREGSCLWRCRAHRLIYKFMTGKEPPEEIDHIDGNPDNNRWNNLRPATRAQQSYNARLQKNNTSGYRGVSSIGEKWMAQSCSNGVFYYHGLFDTAEEAFAAYEDAVQDLHGEFYLKNGKRKLKT